jgi:hypothetical protein
LEDFLKKGLRIFSKRRHTARQVTGVKKTVRYYQQKYFSVAKTRELKGSFLKKDYAKKGSNVLTTL